MVTQGVSPGFANKRKHSAPEGRQKKAVASRACVFVWFMTANKPGFSFPFSLNKR